MIQVYAPTPDSEDVEIEKFYEEIEKAKDYLKSQDIIIVMGDFNAKVGDERVEDVVGPCGIGTVNERGNKVPDDDDNVWVKNCDGYGDGKGNFIGESQRHSLRSCGAGQQWHEANALTCLKPSDRSPSASLCNNS
ncbi:craniofacial development protein 2-like [Plakobranchus ocellatus]|uniref:Craniofacial development protein 2-like n=1 Tax=Plakobranchus ocellatus TaxID=259542 RepID=A0AAV3ZJX8_9GAST|nr:craniofacial development protein 2-like [Plakobranchus ocellatus]